MSRSTNCTLTCPCGEVFSSPIYEYVNIAEDPQLQYTILAGLLNVSTCPACHRRTAIARPLIYSDPARNLLAYVHPRADTPEEARSLILEKLRSVYITIAQANAGEDASGEQNGYAKAANGNHSGNHAQSSTYHLNLQPAAEMPPLQVVFGFDQLNELINVSLSQDERLGRLALCTQSRSEAERGQMLDIARRLASAMDCQVEVEDMPDEYTIWLYGSRRQIGALMRELALHG